MARHHLTWWYWKLPKEFEQLPFGKIWHHQLYMYPFLNLPFWVSFLNPPFSCITPAGRRFYSRRLHDTKRPSQIHRRAGAQHSENSEILADTSTLFWCYFPGKNRDFPGKNREFSIFRHLRLLEMWCVWYKICVKGDSGSRNNSQWFSRTSQRSWCVKDLLQAAHIFLWFSMGDFEHDSNDSTTLIKRLDSTGRTWWLY